MVPVSSAGQRHKRLESRTRRLLRLNGAVQQRMVGIIGDLFPILRLDAHRKLIGIEGGPADHGQHLAGARIERHHGPVAAIHGQLGHGLQIQVDRELNVFAGNGRLVADNLPYLAAIVHHHLPLAVHAHERIVVLALDAEFADHIALTVFGELGRVQFLFADFAGVPDHVRRHAVLRIQAPLRRNEHQLGKEIVVRIDESQIGGRQFLFDYDRHILGLRFEPPDARRQVVVIQVEALGDGLQVFFLDGFAGQNQGERIVVIDDHAPVAVENAAARRQQRHRLDAVLLRALVIELRILHLQLPKPGNQEKEDAHGGVLENGDLTGREASIIAQRGFPRDL